MEKMTMFGVVIVCMAIAQLSAAISLKGAFCGQLVCSFEEYCNPEDNRCAPCTSICNEDSHNHDLALCESKCQNYLHDRRYALKDEQSGDSDASLKTTIQNLQFKLLIFTNLTLAVLILLVLFLGIKFFWFVKNNYSKLSWACIKKKLQSPKKVPHKISDSNPHKLDIPTVSSNDPQTLNVRSLHDDGHQRRQPAEDASLDYSYDNIALNVTPSLSTRQAQM